MRSDSIFSVRDLLQEVAPAVAFFVTGLVLRARRPGNLVGGLCFPLGLLGLVSWMLTQYAGYGLVTHPGSLRGALGIHVVMQPSWALQLVLLVVLVCVFPDGRLLPGRWRVVPWASAAAFGVLFAFGMTTTPSTPFQHVHNPLHVFHSPLLLLGLVVAIPLSIASVVGAVATVVVRFRHARGDEREQLKWLILAAAVLPVGLVAHSIADAVAPVADGVIEPIFSVAIVAFPVAIGIAVLKYRLYEIDRIISRTLVYGVLSALLAGAYFATVLALQASFGSLTHGNELAVACSTLAWRRSSVRCGGASRRWSTGVSTEAGSMPRRRWRASARGCGTRPTSTRWVGELRSVIGQILSPAHVSLWLREDARNDLETVAQ